MVKHFFSRTKKLWGWISVYSMEDFKFVQMVILGWLWPFKGNTGRSCMALADMQYLFCQVSESWPSCFIWPYVCGVFSKTEWINMGLLLLEVEARWRRLTLIHLFILKVEWKMSSWHLYLYLVNLFTLTYVKDYFNPQCANHNNSRRHFLNIFYHFFIENKLTFMWIVCQADDSHEMSRLIFYEKKKKECRMLQILLGALREYYWRE